MKKRDDRKGESKMMKCGMMATITRYGNCGDIDVEFEDHSVALGRQYYNFNAGTITPDGYIRNCEKRKGEKRIMNCGLEGKIVAYRGADDIDVEFPDKSVKKHAAYGSFVRGHLLPPTHRENYINSKKGTTSIATNGMKMTCIEYIDASCVDIRFEDGTIVRDRRYAEFLSGNIAHPNMKHARRKRA